MTPTGACCQSLAHGSLMAKRNPYFTMLPRQCEHLYITYMVKNPFGLFDELFLLQMLTHVLLTELTPIDKMQLLLKPYIFDKIRHDTFHS
jgi:hypothetical protein